MTEHERYLHEHIDSLRRQYEAAIKPYLDELVRIKSYATVVRVEMPRKEAPPA